jgi:arylsulfatase A-like enzyme
VHEFDVDFIYSQAARFIDAADASQRSWFAYLAAAAPHAPFETEARNQGAAVPPWHGDPAVFERDRSDKPSYVRARHSSFAKGRKIRTEQLRSLMSVDDMLGRLHALLARKEALSDTLVILLSDNGLGWGQHGLTGKAVPYTFSIQVPMFMSWPGHIPSRSSDGRMAANIDITPTILDAAGLHPRLVAPLDGRSLLQEWRRKVVLTEFWNRRSGGVPQWASLRSKRWQYVEYYGPDGRSPRIREYYDLEHDPWQLHNLLGDRDPANDPSNVPELSRRLSAARGCSGSSCP